MELPEIEQLVGEAENRVERLRSLYDQYFMGIERIEPQTARKDVERRIQVLRKTQIRNTALRFRFQNVLLRYNTFSAHWLRICRQIEDGTYKHHLRKAKERFDPNEAAREAHAARKAAAKLEYGDTEPPGPPTFEMDEDLDVDVDFDGGSDHPPGRRSSRPPSVDAPDVRAALRPHAIPQEAMARPVASKPAAGAPQPPARGAPVRDPSLDRSAPPVAARPAPPAPAPARPGPPPPPLPNRAAPAAKPPPPPQAKAPQAAPPPVPAAASAKPAAPAPTAARPAAPPVAAPVAANPAAARPAQPAPAPRAGLTSGIGQSTSRPVVPPQPAAAARPAPKPAEPQHDARTREIYSKYVETRRSLGESTAAVTMESMAKSLRESGEKLRQKHPGKTVDFDVQVKDGKTILKPIVR